MTARGVSHGPCAPRAPDSARPHPLLEVEDLLVEYRSRGGTVRALDGATLTVRAGARVGVVGESGSGKTTLGLALPRLLPGSAFVQGSIRFQGQEVLGASDREMRSIRGADIAVVFQDAASSFNPVRTIGAQIIEAIRAHARIGRRAARDRAAELLAEVDVPRPRERLGQYPHQLSGGQRQRAMIAMALSSSPRLLIADEPTSALDVTTQAEVIELLTRLSEERLMTTLLITHDLGVVARFASEVVVLYGGRLMELADSERVLLRPFHPYTADLVASVPRLGGQRQHRMSFIAGSAPTLRTSAVGCVYQPRCPIGSDLEECRTAVPALQERGEGGTVSRVACHRAGEYTAPAPEPVPGTTSAYDEHDPVLLATSISKTYRLRKGGGDRAVRAVADVSLSIARGESVGLVGESGSGKTTLARIIVGLTAPDEGEIEYRATKGERREARPQMVFQDPGDSLDPLMTVQQLVTEPLLIRRGRSRNPYRSEAEQLLASVGLGTDFLDRRPAQLSGGQRQRVAIARALSTEPELIVADEAVSALDMSARGQILNLLADLREEYGLAYLHISHDLTMVRHICDRVAVMQSGQIVETAPVDQLFSAPQHPYTQLLLASVPTPDPVVERGRRSTP